MELLYGINQNRCTYTALYTHLWRGRERARKSPEIRQYKILAIRLSLVCIYYDGSRYIVRFTIIISHLFVARLQFAHYSLRCYSFVARNSAD